MVYFIPVLCFVFCVMWMLDVPDNGKFNVECECIYNVNVFITVITDYNYGIEKLKI